MLFEVSQAESGTWLSPPPPPSLGIVLSFSLCRGCLSPRSALRKQGVPALPTAQDQKPSAFSYHLLSRILEVSERERDKIHDSCHAVSVFFRPQGTWYSVQFLHIQSSLVLSCFVFETGSQCVFQTVLKFMNSDGSLTSVFMQP